MFTYKDLMCLELGVLSVGYISYQYLQSSLKKDEEGQTVIRSIRFAAKTSDWKTLEGILLSNNLSTSELMEVFVIAAERRAPSWVYKLLIDLGCDINQRNQEGTTPLIAAAWSSGTIEQYQSLLAYGANPNYQDKFGQTPLFGILAKNPCFDSVKLLLMHGANPSMTDEFARSPIQYCENDEISSLLKHGKYFNLLFTLKSPQTIPRLARNGKCWIRLLPNDLIWHFREFIN